MHDRASVNYILDVSGELRAEQDSHSSMQCEFMAPKVPLHKAPQWPC